MILWVRFINTRELYSGPVEIGGVRPAVSLHSSRPRMFASRIESRQPLPEHRRNFEEVHETR